MTDRELLQRAFDEIREAGGYSDELISDIRAQLEEPEQEPVAWMFQHDETGRMSYVSNDGMNTPENFLQANRRYKLVCPLYTALLLSAQKPLTDEQIASCWDDNSYDETAFARAIEVAHGIGEKK